MKYGSRLTFENSHAGFNRLIRWIRTLQTEHGKTNVLFGVEPTGHYWIPLAQFLRKQGIQVMLVNPLHVKNKSKELDDNSPTKNDIKGCPQDVGRRSLITDTSSRLSPFDRLIPYFLLTNEAREPGRISSYGHDPVATHPPGLHPLAG